MPLRGPQRRERQASILGVRSSAKKIQRICAAISEQTKRTWVFLDPDEMVGRLNRMLRGWANYFTLGAVSVAYRTVERHVCFSADLGRKLGMQ
jgi:RNA-directed DNA polymerase